MDPKEPKHDDHGHNHDHSHDAITASKNRSYYEIMEIAVRELLVEQKLIGADEIRRQIEVLDSRTPALGAKVVARAWELVFMTIRSLSSLRTPIRFTILSFARFAPAIRGQFWVFHQTGIS